MDYIPLFKPWITDDDIAAVTGAMRNLQIGGDGPQCRDLEKLLQERLEVPRVLLVTSCTSALDLAMMTIDLQPGDEVIVPSFTFASSATCITQRFGRPVFVDIEPDTFNIAPEQIEAAITPRTRAIMVMHYAGHACRMDEINALAQAHGLSVVEDAAHGVDAYYKGRELGTLGRLGALSFHYTKNLIAGEGGALVCLTDQDARRAEIAREKGTNRAEFLRGEVNKYGWVAPGSSFVISNILGALALEQFGRLEQITRRRIEIAEYYKQQLAEVDEIELPVTYDYAQTNWHLFALRVPRKLRNPLIVEMKQRGVGADSHYLPLHSSRYGLELGAREEDCPVSTEAAETILRLPLFPQMNEAEQAHVVASLKESLVALGA
jgi:dTDP-4-amino-4,6-dideoxygalactose transaminase